ncbi:MAG: hypothetical protein FWF23_00230 [Alphaproteobacteria bacterium]|nr:hypothetical protein [Alphaproteobacteria bacterium]
MKGTLIKNRIINYGKGWGNKKRAIVPLTMNSWLHCKKQSLLPRRIM